MFPRIVATLNDEDWKIKTEATFWHYILISTPLHKLAYFQIKGLRKA